LGAKGLEFREVEKPRVKPGHARRRANEHFGKILLDMH